MASDFISSIRVKITSSTKRLRRSRIQHWDVNVPLSVANLDFPHDGKIYQRKKIILAAPGCSVPTCTICPIPNEGFYGSKEITPDNLINQFKSSFTGEDINRFDMISIYNSGNWFSDREVFPKARRAIYEEIAKSECSTLMVESLPQFISHKNIEETKEYLRDKSLIVAIGLQSSNDFVRNVCVNTVCTKEQFEKASNLLWQSGYTPRAYLILGAPFLSESESIEDVSNSIQYLARLGYTEVALSPMRVTPYTLVYELQNLGLYKPPSLWTIISSIQNAILKTPSMRVWISALEKSGQDNQTLYPQNCPLCTSQIVEALRKYNLDQDLTRLGTLNCSCHDAYLKSLQTTDSKTPIERVIEFLSVYDHYGVSNAATNTTVPLEKNSC